MSQSTDVLELARAAAYRYGIPKLAAKMGIQPGTLYNKLNNDEGCAHHKLTLQDLIQIISVTGDTRPLAGLAALFDHALYPLADMRHVSDDALLDLVHRTHISAGQAHRTMADALADGDVTAEEFARVANDCRDWIAAIITLKLRFGGLVVSINERRA